MHRSIILVILVGCSGGRHGNGNGDTPGPDTTPHITLDTPVSGDEHYGSSVLGSFSVENFTLNADAIDGDNVAGEGHVHAYVDDVLVGETADNSFEFIDLPSGKHTLEVRLADNDHSERGAGSWAWVQTLDSGLQILSPVDGTPLTASSAPMTLQLSDFVTDSTVAFADPAFGQGRYNVLLDGTLVDYGFDPAGMEVTQIPEGDHTIELQLATSDGVPIDPPVSDSVALTVAPLSPYLAVDRSQFLGTFNSASIPIDVTVANATLSYHVYLDGTFAANSTEAEVVLPHVAPGYHLVDVRLTNGGSELMIHDHANVYVAPTRPDVLITYPGDRWGVASAFDLSMTTENFTLDAAAMGGANEDGHGHYAVLIDGVQVQEAATPTVPISGLTTGAHAITLELENNDGTPLDPAVDTTINITVH